MLAGAHACLLKPVRLLVDGLCLLVLGLLGSLESVLPRQCLLRHHANLSTHETSNSYSVLPACLPASLLAPCPGCSAPRKQAVPHTPPASPCGLGRPPAVQALREQASAWPPPQLSLAHAPTTYPPTAGQSLLPPALAYALSLLCLPPAASTLLARLRPLASHLVARVRAGGVFTEEQPSAGSPTPPAATASSPAAAAAAAVWAPVGAMLAAEAVLLALVHAREAVPLPVALGCGAAVAGLTAAAQLAPAMQQQHAQHRVGQGGCVGM